MLNAAVLAPIASVNVTIAAAANAGVRLKLRTPYRTSLVSSARGDSKFPLRSFIVASTGSVRLSYLSMDVTQPSFCTRRCERAYITTWRGGTARIGLRQPDVVEVR